MRPRDGGSRHTIRTGAGLLLLVIALLVGGYVLSRALGDAVAVDDRISYGTPEPAAATAARTPGAAGLLPRGEATYSPMAATAEPPTATPAAAATEPQVAATAVSTAVATPAASKPVGAGGIDIPRARGDIGRLPKGDEYQEAYARYWETLHQAYAGGDPGKLPQVMEGPLLAEVEATIRADKARGRGTLLRIDTKELQFLDKTSEGFVVQHTYVDRSAYRDLATGKALPRDEPPIAVQQNTFLRKIDGRWKALAINKQAAPGVIR